MANYNLYEMKDMLPNLFSTEMAFRAGRFMGRELDNPSVDEIIRPAKIKAVDLDKKLVSIEWLDVPGGQTDVLLNFPAVGRDWGIYFCPQVNDWCTCAIERGRVRILTWVPRNVSRLKKLQPGEVMIESGGQGTLHMDRDGNIHMAAKPERDKEKIEEGQTALDNPSNIPRAEVKLGNTPHPFSSDKNYEVQIFSQHGDRIFNDGFGNVSQYTSRNKKFTITGNYFITVGMSYTQFIKDNKIVEIEKDKDETVRCGGQSQSSKLNVMKDYKITVGKDYTSTISGKTLIDSKGPIIIKSGATITLIAPRIDLNPGSGGLGSPIQSAMQNVANVSQGLGVPGANGGFGGGGFGMGVGAGGLGGGGFNGGFGGEFGGIGNVGSVGDMCSNAMGGGGFGDLTSGLSQDMTSAVGDVCGGGIGGGSFGGFSSAMDGASNIVSDHSGGRMGETSSLINCPYTGGSTTIQYR